MTRAAVIMAVVSALCLGVSLGFMGGVVMSRRLLQGGPQGPLGLGPERRLPHVLPPGEPEHAGMPSSRKIMKHLERLLDLSPEQADVIRGEIERTRGEFAQVRDSLHTRVERHLTAQQRQHWLAAVREQKPDEPFKFEKHEHH